MHTSTTHPQPLSTSSFLEPSNLKKGLQSALLSPTSKQSQLLNQQVGDYPLETQIQDSCYSKYTKCTSALSSTFFDENQSEEIQFKQPQKVHRKELKKEMKKQKAKRKQQAQNQKTTKKVTNMLLNISGVDLSSSLKLKNTNDVKSVGFPFSKQSLNYKIQKFPSDNIANSEPRKKVHCQSASVPTRIEASYDLLFQSLKLKTGEMKMEDSKSTGLDSNNGNSIEEQVTLDFQKKSEYRSLYFVDDLIKEYKVKKESKPGKKVKTPKLSFLKNMLNLSESCQIPIQNAKPEISKIDPIALQRRPQDEGKKTLLLDLDDTLIFTQKPFAVSELSDLNNTVIYHGDDKCRNIFIRPHAKQFIARMSQHFEIIIFTAATKNYAEQIRKILDPSDQFISHLLDRQSCFNPNSKLNENNKLPFVKDLRRIDRDLSQTILLDNSIYCFWYQIQNGIPITSYNRVDKNDIQLLKVENYLMSLKSERDVRVMNKEILKLEKYEQFVDSLTLVEELYIEHQI